MKLSVSFAKSESFWKFAHVLYELAVKQQVVISPQCQWCSARCAWAYPSPLAWCAWTTRGRSEVLWPYLLLWGSSANSAEVSCPQTLVIGDGEVLVFLSEGSVTGTVGLPQGTCSKPMGSVQGGSWKSRSLVTTVRPCVSRLGFQWRHISPA